MPREQCIPLGRVRARRLGPSAQWGAIHQRILRQERCGGALLTRSCDKPESDGCRLWSATAVPQTTNAPLRLPSPGLTRKGNFAYNMRKWVRWTLASAEQSAHHGFELAAAACSSFSQCTLILLRRHRSTQKDSW